MCNFMNLNVNISMDKLSLEEKLSLTEIYPLEESRLKIVFEYISNK